MENEMTEDTGGPAFPISIPGRGDNGAEGMSLRDYFAGQALTGMLASAPVADRSKPNHKGWAANAYAFADAMIAERKKP